MSNREKASLNLTMPENLVKANQSSSSVLPTSSISLLVQPHLACQEYLPGEFASLLCQWDSHSPGGPRAPSRDAQSLGGPEAAANPTTAQPELCLPCPAQLTGSKHNAHPWTAMPPAAFHSSAPSPPWAGLIP